MFGIELRENETLGNWSLGEYGIAMADIPREIMSNVGPSSISKGALSKFTFAYDKEVVPGLDKNVYVKAGEYSAGTYDIKQPLVETIASELGALLQFQVQPSGLWIIDAELFKDPPLDYEDEEDDGFVYGRDRLVSPVALPKSFARTLNYYDKVLVGFTNSYHRENYGYNSCFNEFGNMSGATLHRALCDKGESVRRQVHQMFVFDFLIGNADRHHRNFGFLNNIYGDQEEMAPLVDHGQGLLATVSFGDPDEEEDYHRVNNTIGHQTTFSDLRVALDHVAVEDIKGYIDLSVSSEELCKVVDKYAPLFGDKRRIKLMKQILEMRWTMCQERFTT